MWDQLARLRTPGTKLESFGAEIFVLSLPVINTVPCFCEKVSDISQKLLHWIPDATYTQLKIKSEKPNVEHTWYTALWLNCVLSRPIFII